MDIVKWYPHFFLFHPFPEVEIPSCGSPDVGKYLSVRSWGKDLSAGSLLEHWSQEAPVVKWGSDLGRKGSPGSLVMFIPMGSWGSVPKDTWGTCVRRASELLHPRAEVVGVFTCQLPSVTGCKLLGVQACPGGRWAFSCSLQAEWKVLAQEAGGFTDSESRGNTGGAPTASAEPALLPVVSCPVGFIF